MGMTGTSSGALPLGVVGLGNDAAGWLGPGRLYALNARIPSLRFPLIAAAIESAQARGTPCTIVLRSKPDAYLAQIDTSGRMDIDAHLASGVLGVLVMRDEFGKRMFQLGPERFARELSGFGVMPGSLVVFEHAADLLNMRDKGLATHQVEVLDAWCREHGCTGLLVFSGNSERNAVPVTDLLDGLAGLAVLEAAQGHLTIDFPYWRCDARLSGCHHLALHLDARGHYRVGASNGRATAVGDIRAVDDADQGRVEGSDALAFDQPDLSERFDHGATVRVPSLAVFGRSESRVELSMVSREDRPAHSSAAPAEVPLRSFEGRAAAIASGSTPTVRAYATGRATRVRLVEPEVDDR